MYAFYNISTYSTTTYIFNNKCTHVHILQHIYILYNHMHIQQQMYTCTHSTTNVHIPQQKFTFNNGTYSTTHIFYNTYIFYNVYIHCLPMTIKHENLNTNEKRTRKEQKRKGPKRISNQSINQSINYFTLKKKSELWYSIGMRLFVQLR